MVARATLAAVWLLALLFLTTAATAQTWQGATYARGCIGSWRRRASSTRRCFLAQERTQDAFAELVSKQGVPAGQADEATRELWAFLPSEEDPDGAEDPGP